MLIKKDVRSLTLKPKSYTLGLLRDTNSLNHSSHVEGLCRLAPRAFCRVGL